MKIPLLLVSSIAVLLLVACPVPTGLNLETPGTVEEPPVVEPGPRVETDTARRQAVYVNEDGQRFDVVAVDDDGADVACVEAVDISVLDPEPEAGLPSDGNASAAPPAPGLKAVISGRRSDGSYALWAVLRDDSIHLVFCEGGDRREPTMPECGERDGWLRGWMGWRYHVTGTATDGASTIVVGYAVHERGFRRGPWTVEPGTTIGVYWKVFKSPTRPYCYVTPARIIGVRNPAWHPPWRWHWHWPRGWLRGLKHFLDGYFASYLTMATGVTWDGTNLVFVVPGTNEEGNPAEATIDRQGRITITEVQEEKPDLTIDSLTVEPDLLHMGDTFKKLEANVKNIGSAPVAAIIVRFTVSSDAVLDKNDTFAGEVEITSLDVDETKKALVPEPVSLANPGTQWIFVTADPGDEIDEEDEGNNTKSASVAVYYERLIIDTYNPYESGGFPTDTFLSLYADTGVAHPPLAENDDGNPIYFSAARIDYKKPAGIAPGTVFYARVRGKSSSVAGEYAIRLVTSDPDSYGSTWFDFGSGDESGYEPDEAMDGSVPKKPVPLPVEGKLHRGLSLDDVDWVKLVLP